MFYNNYVDQCNKMGLSPSAAAEAMGFKRSVVTRWANGTKPRQATLQRIASFFGCTVEDLEKEKAPSEDGERGMTDDDLKFALWGGDKEEMDDEDLKAVREYAEFIRDRKRKGNQ